MKTINILEVKENLARLDAENLDGRDLYELFLEGYQGYLNYSDRDCLDWYIDKGEMYDSEVDDEDQVQLAVVIDKEKNPIFNVFQHQGRVYFLEAN